MQAIDHLALIHGVRDAVLANLPADYPQEIADRLRAAKLCYGIGNGSYRGVTYAGAWTPADGADGVDLVEIAATGEENAWQIACTTVHELGHVAAGILAQHGADWKSATATLGLRKPRQAGQRYYPISLEPTIRRTIATLIARLSGAPRFRSLGTSKVIGLGFTPTSAGPCRVGHKVRVVVNAAPRITYACACGTRIVSQDDISDVTCRACEGPFVAISNGRRGRPKAA